MKLTRLPVDVMETRAVRLFAVFLLVVALLTSVKGFA